jgi:hypothetical protein
MLERCLESSDKVATWIQVQGHAIRQQRAHADQRVEGVNDARIGVERTYFALTAVQTGYFQEIARQLTKMNNVPDCMFESIKKSKMKTDFGKMISLMESSFMRKVKGSRV